MAVGELHPRLRRLAISRPLGIAVPTADDPRSRILGLASIGRDRAGSGLLITRCAAVHTWGMRFALDLVFLDERGAVLSVRREVGPRRFRREPGAAAVLELVAGRSHPSGW